MHLGNLDAVRDWGYAPEYVEGMWRMLQADRPDDYVLATGTATTVGQWVEYCFAHVGLDWREHVRFDETYLRPTEVDALIGDASKARAALGWQARTMPEQLAKIMVDADLVRAHRAAASVRRASVPRPVPSRGGVRPRIG